MTFNALDARMRVFEELNDAYALPGIYLVARIDGRGFTRLTKETHAFDAPFDARFRDLMLATAERLMTCGFEVAYAYTQSDEISLLFDPRADAFGRKLRKYNSVLAGEASAAFSVALGAPAAFDCRVCQLPSTNHVVDYFRWRAEDALRNALTGHCYWALRRTGRSAAEATAALRGLSTADKNELLFRHGTNFNDVPAWQKRGSGLYWETYEKKATNPATGAITSATRRRIRRDLELPVRQAYADFIRARLPAIETARAG